MNSMTGYGKGKAECEGRSVTVELKSVNHRYLDINIRLPRHISFVEDLLRKALGERFSRGHIDVFVNYLNTRSDARTVRIDNDLLGAYLTSARETAAQFGLTDDITLSSALKLPDVSEVLEADEDRDTVNSLCLAALDEAAKELADMRFLEGERLKTDLSARVDTVLDLTDKIAVRAPLVVEEYRTKLNERIEKILETGDIDRARLATEVALFADKASIDEEIVRLNSHVTQIRLLFRSNEPVGRKLDFLVQEFNREFNTIGSKANDGTLTTYVLAGKNEIEKIREQVQNIE